MRQHSRHLPFLAGQKVTSRRRAYQAKGFEFYLECSAVEVHSEASRDLLVTGGPPLHSSRDMFGIACSQHIACQSPLLPVQPCCIAAEGKACIAAGKVHLLQAAVPALCASAS